MAASAGLTAFHTVLIWNYRELLEITNINGPAQSRDMLNVTSHDSDNGFKEYIAGPIDGGEVSVEGNLIVGDTYGQVAFHTDVQGGTKRAAFIVAPMAAAEAWSFNAFAKGFTPSHPHDAQIGVSGSLIVTGKPTRLTTQSAGMSGLTGIEENAGAGLSISPAIAVGTYAYTCTVNTASTWVKLTPVAGSHTIYVQGVAVATGVQSGEIALGAAGTDTVVIVIAYESAKSPRIYRLTVTRPAA